MHNLKLSDFWNFRGFKCLKGLNLTVVCCHNRLESDKAYVQWHIREVFSSWLNPRLHKADGRQNVWSCVSEWFADDYVVDGVVHGGCGVMVWAGLYYKEGAFYGWHFKNTEIHMLRS